MPYKFAVERFRDRLFQAVLAYEGRLGARLTQTTLAGMMDVSQPTIAEWLSGTRTPSIEQAAKLAHLLGVSPGWLAFEEGAMLSGYHEPPKPLPMARKRVETKPKGKRRPR